MNWFEKMKKKQELKKGDIEAQKRKIEELTKDKEPGTDDYDKLRRAYEQELKNEKLIKEIGKMGVDWGKIAMWCAILVLGGGALLVEMESPKALKVATFVLNLIKKV
jgi:intein/homing endonuclease